MLVTDAMCSNQEVLKVEVREAIASLGINIAGVYVLVKGVGMRLIVTSHR